MFRNLLVLGLVVFLGGKTVRSMAVKPSDKGATNSTISQIQEKEIFSPTDLAIRKLLNEITKRVFRDDDSFLISLIRRGIVEATTSITPISIEAGAKKAQRYVTDVTAAYTQAIFGATSPSQAEEILRRFQNTIQRIVDYAKRGQFTS